MKTIEATYRIVTPMFIGGADQTPDDGIRPPSFKGALRFWWRALNWGRFYKGDEAVALRDMHAEEARLFGAAAKTEGSKQTGGQGCFLITIKENGVRTELNDWPMANTGAGYLAYGIIESKGGKSGVSHPHKKGLREGLKFTVILKFCLSANEEDITSIKQSLKVLGLLGGLGSRNRRGMGSISIEYQGELLTREDYMVQLNQIFPSKGKLPPFTAFSGESKYKLLRSEKKARDVLEMAGKKYKEFRSSIKNRRDERLSFGLPLQDVETEKRRASPLFFHVQALSGNHFAPIIFYLPASQFYHDQGYQHINFLSIKAFLGALP